MSADCGLDEESIKCRIQFYATFLSLVKVFLEVPFDAPVNKTFPLHWHGLATDLGARRVHVEAIAALWILLVSGQDGNVGFSGFESDVGNIAISLAIKT